MTGKAGRECFGCGNRFERELLEEIGDTVFCRACHARMLRRIDERRGRGADSATGEVRALVRGPAGPAVAPLAGAGPADRGAMAKPTAADAPCFVCGGPLAGATLFELRGFAICGNCARGLIGDGNDDAQAGDDAPDADAPGDDDASDDERGAAPYQIAPEGSSRVVDTPGGGTEWCTGCERAMPGRGSYQLVAGRPYCAACVATRAARSGPVRASAPADDAPPSPDTCDACSRAIDPAAVPETKGFRLCAACLNSDPELALAIARSRHQRRLARAGRRLLDGDDD